MPSVSRLQHRFMQIASHDKKFAEQHHIPQKVAKEFVDADRRAGKFQDSSIADKSPQKK